jgi:hypothetical protein
MPRLQIVIACGWLVRAGLPVGRWFASRARAHAADAMPRALARVGAAVRPLRAGAPA